MKENRIVETNNGMDKWERWNKILIAELKGRGPMDGKMILKWIL
jgi:hypothetical protein